MFRREFAHRPGSTKGIRPVEVEAYRPFFILGEVTNPGQYAYVAT
jgi:hypothetical protein